MSSLPIITSIPSVQEFYIVLNQNPGLVIIKLGAEWCEPCKIIEETVQEYFNKSPPNIQCCNLDVDTNFELFGYFKKKKIVKGIPSLLCYQFDNEDGYPDDFMSGGEISRTKLFFERCFTK